MRRLAVLAALTLVVGSAEAQVAPRRFSVGAHVGRTMYDEATALKDAGFAGIDASYTLPSLGRLDLGVGFNITASLPVTRYDQFPAVLFDFGDTSFIYGVSQRVRVFDYGAQGTIGTTLGRLRVYGIGGAGLYTIQVDPRQEGKLQSYTEPAFQVGAGANYVVSRTLGFRVEARNAIWTNFDRDRLDATVKYAQDRRLRDEFAAPVPAKSTVNNLRLAIVFSYVPGGDSASDEQQQGGGQ